MLRGLMIIFGCVAFAGLLLGFGFLNVSGTIANILFLVGVSGCLITIMVLVAGKAIPAEVATKKPFLRTWDERSHRDQELASEVSALTELETIEIDECLASDSSRNNRRAFSADYQTEPQLATRK